MRKKQAQFIIRGKMVSSMPDSFLKVFGIIELCNSGLIIQQIRWIQRGLNNRRSKMIEIVIEDDIYITKNKNVVDTKIHIEENGRCFPSDGWTDFTFPILEWWKNNLISARYADNHSFQLPFCDGPFWLEVQKNENMELKIECVNDRTKRRTELTTYCGYYEFLQELYNAFKTFSKILYKNNMHEGDFSSIYRQTMLSVNELKEILK